MTKRRWLTLHFTALGVAGAGIALSSWPLFLAGYIAFACMPGSEVIR